jgi:hypothetical protein
VILSVRDLNSTRLGVGLCNGKFENAEFATGVPIAVRQRHLSGGEGYRFDGFSDT